MKKINPYTPGAGVMPGYLAGRDEVIQEGKDSIYSLMHGYPRQPIIYYGLRGVGKTVLLTALNEYVIKEGVLTFHFEIQEKVSLINDIILSANQTLSKISKVEKIKNIFEVAKNSLPCTVANVAHILNKDLKSISPIRVRLINKGLIYATRHGEIDFTIPKFDEFLKRISK